MADNNIPDPVLSEVLRLLGMDWADGNVDFFEKINMIYRGLVEAAAPKTVSKMFDISIGSDSVTFDGLFQIHGRDIAELCRSSRRAVLFAVTLGAQVDRLIQRTQAGNMYDAVILDACASAEVERICDNTEHEIIRQMLRDEEFLTMRFSPGYGDVPIEDSEKIIEALNATKNIGLSLTRSKMLVPLKSVTAIIGISEKREPRSKGCGGCTIKDSCRYRRRGEFCGVQDK